jgi:CBS domain-containing protein
MLISDVLRAKGSEVVKIRQTESVTAAVRKLADRRIGALLVEDQWMKPVGIFSERDFVNAMAKQAGAALDLTVQQLMSSPMVTCKPSDRIDAVMATMTTKKIRHLPVMEGGNLLGMISIGDLVKHRLDEKELEASVLLEIARMRV